MCFSTLNAQQNNRSQSFNRVKGGSLVSIYPSPAKDFINIKVKDESHQIKLITLYSILGIQVAEYKTNSNSVELRLDRLRPGKYLMRYVLSDNVTQITQFIKQ